MTVITNSPYLQGALAPVADEGEDLHLTVRGALPDALRGAFVRNGPNPQFAPLGNYHPFDGDGMIHAVYFEDGGVRYRNAWVRSDGLLAERKRGRACYGGFGQFSPPDPDVMAEGGLVKNVSNTHFVRHSGRYLSLMEACPPIEMDAELHTLGTYDFDGRLVGPMTAHPKIDPVSGDMEFFGYSPLAPFLKYHVVASDGALVHSTDIDLERPVMMHDFALTENFAIFLDSPVVMDLGSFMSGGSMTKWQPEFGARIGVLPRRADGGEIRWFDIDLGYIVHFFNAWDTVGSDGPDTVEIHAPRFERMPGGLDSVDQSSTSDAVPWRYSIDLAAGTVTERQLDDRPGEFPRVNEHFVTRRHRYAYNGLMRSGEFEFDFGGVVKYDISDDSAATFEFEDDFVAGEHVFAPDPEGAAEDEGWLLSFVASRSTGASSVEVLDARDVAAGPVASVEIPRRVPIGFHANWFGAE